MKKWNYLHIPKDAHQRYAIPEITEILLANRGIETEQEVDEFLHPSLDRLSYDGVGLKTEEMEKATQRLQRAINDKEPITVYTDYDVDGVCSGAIIWETLYRLGAAAKPYIPHRVEEGYGLSKKGIDTIKKEHNTKVLVTVDHGVTAAEKIAYAASLGIETIVVDHHVLPSQLPQTVALVHTTRLCAGGIAWFFADFLDRRINSKYDETIRNKNLTLAALATIADLIPLTGPNRILVYFGLKELNRTSRVGLNALIRESGLIKGEIDVYNVSHIIAPRINAMGRITHALDALRLICTTDSARATELAQLLGTTNRDRQLLTEEATLHAMDLVRSTYMGEDGKFSQKLIFISHESYNQGVIGLIAGKLTQSYNLPSIVVARGEQYSKASARSIRGFNIVEIIRKAQDILVDVGGHPMAAGFTVETKHLEELRTRLMAFALESISDEQLTKTIDIDMKLDLSMVSDDLYEAIQQLSPFGVGNPQPVFASRDVAIVNASVVGRDGRHLKMLLRPGDGPKRALPGGFEAIGFGLGPLYAQMRQDTHIDIAYTVSEDTWNNHRRLQLKLVDAKISTGRQ